MAKTPAIIKQRGRIDAAISARNASLEEFRA
jgi:hypothetical protein